MSRVLILTVYFSLITCGILALLGDPSPTLERQGGGLVTMVWSSLCIAAGCAGAVGMWRRSRALEILGSYIGASATGAWAASLILQGIKTGSLNTASAACLGTALTALLAHQARRVSGGT